MIAWALSSGSGSKLSPAPDYSPRPEFVPKALVLLIDLPLLWAIDGALTLVIAQAVTLKTG